MGLAYFISARVPSQGRAEVILLIEGDMIMKLFKCNGCGELVEMPDRQ